MALEGGEHGAALGPVVAVLEARPIVSFLPVLLIEILFGLAMDYEVFLVSRIREAYVCSGNPREAIVTGSARAAGSSRRPRSSWSACSGRSCSTRTR